MSPPTPRTRLAPSPTGALHLGNARTFLINWALAKQRGQRVLLRIEDLDGPRIKRGADRLARDTLAWLGLDWDEGPLYQSSDLGDDGPYHAALARLRRQGYIYPCDATRKEIEAARSAPHGDEHELRYPGLNRPAHLGGEGASEPAMIEAVPLLDEDAHAWRLVVPDGNVIFHDELHGEQAIDVQQQVGDFVVATKAGTPAYQLAVVVDDARQGVTHVVRGDDLLRSTARQVLLYRLLNLGEPPAYCHVPLVIGEDGRRLAKRHGDTRLARYREAGVAADRVVGLLAAWCGVTPHRDAGGEPEPMPAEAFAERFALSRLPREPVVLTEEDERWLLG